jgi:hypothetical protein
MDLIDRDTRATLEQTKAAGEEAYPVPLLMAATACLVPRRPDTPPLVRMASMGAAIQILRLGAAAVGFGAGPPAGVRWPADL